MWRRGKVIKRHQRDGRKKKGILKRKEEGKQPLLINTITVLQRAALKHEPARAQHQAAQLRVSAKGTPGFPGALSILRLQGLCASPESFKRIPVKEFPEVSVPGQSLGKLRRLLKSWLGFCSQQSPPAPLL